MGLLERPFLALLSQASLKSDQGLPKNGQQGPTLDSPLDQALRFSLESVALLSGSEY
jgi:hypothetical protein